MAQNGIPLVAKKWTNQKNDPTVSREWQNYAYTVNFIEIGQQTPKLWPKRCPLVAKKWTILKSDGTIETALKKEAYPENFRILSQKTPKRVTFRRPYLRKLFPFLQFYLITQKSWLKTSKRKYKHFKSQKPVPWWPKIEPIKNLSPPVVVSGIRNLMLRVSLQSDHR